MDLVIDKLDDSLKLKEFAARHRIPAVSDLGSSKLKYLVTGGSGFIGSMFIKKALEQTRLV